MERRDLSTAKMEYTTQKIRQEWADHEDQILGNGDGSVIDQQSIIDWQTTSTLSNITDVDEAIVPPGGNKMNITDEILSAMKEDAIVPITIDAGTTNNNNGINKDETKSKKKRRKKSMMKKKTSQRKSSSSSSIGSAQSDAVDNDNEQLSTSISNNTGNCMTESSSPDDSPKQLETPLDAAAAGIEENDLSIISESLLVNKIDSLPPLPHHINTTPPRLRDLDIHFFSDTELASGKSPHGSRPQTPIQSDSEYEMSNRIDSNSVKNDIMTNSASWKWGELPTQDTTVHQTFDTEDAKQAAQRNSMLSNMFSFMKQSKKLRNNSSEGVYLSELDTNGMDPKMMDLYFPPIKSSSSSGGGGGGAININDREDDIESGNGTSLPHSPSSLEEPKSLDSDYDEDKSTDNK